MLTLMFCCFCFSFKLHFNCFLGYMSFTIAVYYMLPSGGDGWMAGYMGVQMGKRKDW